MGVIFPAESPIGTEQNAKRGNYGSNQNADQSDSKAKPHVTSGASILSGDPTGLSIFV
jgi:hypothetical protein